MTKYVLAIDEGTTGVTVLLFDKKGKVARKAYSELPQIYPKPSWVEHDAETIWQTTKRLLKEALDGEPASQVAGVGIANQRETTVLWDAETRRPYANAIVWQCRRTAERCRELKESGKEPVFRAKTGLVLDAYFSGTKIAWLLENVPAAAKGAQEGSARFGTIDTWLIDRLSGGRIHATDPTNASRTLVYDIHARRWDDELLSILGVPRGILPSVRGSAEILGMTDAAELGAEVPIAGVAGDQQAALFGQGCVTPGELKNTYGTGCFALMNCGERRVDSRQGLLTTLGCDAKGKPVYCLEGSVFIAGAVIQWCRDALGAIQSAAESEPRAKSVADNAGVYFVPAFVGLGAPYWDQDARGAILGLTRGTGRDHIVRAALESIAYQTRDLIEALELDAGMKVRSLKVDGGAVQNELLMQFQADVLGIPVVRPRNIETTAQGAAYLAGIACGFWSSQEEVASFAQVDRTFKPEIDQKARDRLYAGWKAAVARVRSRQ